MSKADKLQTIANNLATENETVEQQTELLQQIRTALVGKTVPGDPDDSGSYDEGYADGYEEGKADTEVRAIALVNEGLTLSDLAVAGVNSLEEIPEKVDEVYLYGTEEGYESGKKSAIENLPGGYVKIDPAWKDLTFFAAYGRSSMLNTLKYGDTANVTNFQSFCANWGPNDLTVVPSFDYSKGTNFSGMFNWGGYIEEIGEMNIPNATNVTNMFNYCLELKRITFVPGCIKISISFSGSNLLDDVSIQSIIDGLADLTGKTAQTLTLHATVGGKLTQAQKDAASAKNWTLAY